MKLLFLFTTLLMLVACGGGSTSPDTTPKFSQEELENTLLFSKPLLEYTVSTTDDDATIVLFNTANVREIELSKIMVGRSLDGNAEYTEQPWSVLSDGRIQVNYPQGTCFIRKDKETATGIDITFKCANVNAVVTDTLAKPLDFDKTMLRGRKITIQDETTLETWDFSDDDTFNHIFDENINGIGTLSQSSYKNVVRLDYPDSISEVYSLLFLVEGDLNQGGKLIGIRYLNNEILESVKIFIVSPDNRWVVNNYYINWGRFNF